MQNWILNTLSLLFSHWFFNWCALEIHGTGITVTVLADCKMHREELIHNEHIWYPQINNTEENSHELIPHSTSSSASDGMNLNRWTHRIHSTNYFMRNIRIVILYNLTEDWPSAKSLGAIRVPCCLLHITISHRATIHSFDACRSLLGVMNSYRLTLIISQWEACSSRASHYQTLQVLFWATHFIQHRDNLKQFVTEI